MSQVLVDSIAVLSSMENDELKNMAYPINQLMHFMAPPRSTVLTGVGKSFLVAQLGASLFQSIGCMATAIHATDLLHGSLGQHYAAEGRTMIIISHSGNTSEILNLLDEMIPHKSAFSFIVAVTGNRDSRLAERANIVLPYEIDRDGSKHGTIPSVSVTAQIAWLNILVCTRANEMSAEVLAHNHPRGSLAKIYEEKI